MEITIHSGKSLKSGTLAITYSQGKNKKLTLEEKDARPHEDLVHAMQALKIHAAIVAELLVEAEYGITKEVTDKKEKIERPFFASEEIKDQYRCSGIHISEKGIILTATKELQHGSLNYNTPLVNVAFESEAGYRFAMDLKEKAQTAAKEFELFLGGKMAPEEKEEVVNKAQIALPLAEVSEEERLKDAERMIKSGEVFIEQ